MSIFSKRFNKCLLKEAEGGVGMAPSPVPPAADNGDTEAFAATLDPETDPETFNDIDGVKGDLQNMQEVEESDQVSVIMSWIKEMEKITKWLNGLEPDSIQSQLKDSPCDTLLDSISKSETRKITRIAQEISALQQALQGHIQQGDKSSGGEDSHPYGPR